MKDIEKHLHPSDDDLMEAEMAYGQKIEELQESAIVDARKSMNAIQSVSEALKKVAHLDGEKQQEGFLSVINEAARVSNLILSHWGHDPKKRENRWMLNVIEKSIISHIEIGKSLSPATIKSIANTLATREYEKDFFKPWQDQDSILLTVFQGMSNLMKSQSEFDFGRKKTLDKDLDEVREVVFLSAKHIFKEMCPSITPHPDRVIFFNIILKQCFELMVQSWNKNSMIAKNALKNLNDEKLKAWKNSTPNGFGLDPVLKDFEKNSSRLLRLVAITLKKK